MTQGKDGWGERGGVTCRAPRPPLVVIAAPHPPIGAKHPRGGRLSAAGTATAAVTGSAILVQLLGTTAAAMTQSAVAAAASMCSVGELRAGEEGSGPDLAGDDAGAAQRVEVLLRTDGGQRRMNPRKQKYSSFFKSKYSSNFST